MTQKTINGVGFIRTVVIGEERVRFGTIQLAGIPETITWRLPEPITGGR